MRRVSRMLVVFFFVMGLCLLLFMSEAILAQTLEDVLFGGASSEFEL